MRKACSSDRRARVMAGVSLGHSYPDALLRFGVRLGLAVMFFKRVTVRAGRHRHANYDDPERASW